MEFDFIDFIKQIPLMWWIILVFAFITIATIVYLEYIASKVKIITNSIVKRYEGSFRHEFKWRIPPVDTSHVSLLELVSSTPLVKPKPGDVWFNISDGQYKTAQLNAAGEIEVVPYKMELPPFSPNDRVTLRFPDLWKNVIIDPAMYFIIRAIHLDAKCSSGFAVVVDPPLMKNILGEWIDVDHFVLVKSLGNTNNE